MIHVVKEAFDICMLSANLVSRDMLPLMDERLRCQDTFDVDLTVLDPVIYSGKYHSLEAVLGKIGDFLPTE